MILRNAGYEIKLKSMQLPKILINPLKYKIKVIKFNNWKWKSWFYIHSTLTSLPQMGSDKTVSGTTDIFWISIKEPFFRLIYCSRSCTRWKIPKEAKKCWKITSERLERKILIRLDFSIIEKISDIKINSIDAL